MPTLEKRVGNSGKITWRVRVRRQGSSWQTKSFTKKSDAEAWARSVETRIDAGESLPSTEARKRTLSDAIDEYLKVYDKEAQAKFGQDSTSDENGKPLRSRTFAAARQLNRLRLARRDRCAGSDCIHQFQLCRFRS
jgi:hypothetical protein